MFLLALMPFLFLLSFQTRVLLIFKFGFYTSDSPDFSFILCFALACSSVRAGIYHPGSHGTVLLGTLCPGIIFNSIPFYSQQCTSLNEDGMVWPFPCHFLWNMDTMSRGIALFCQYTVTCEIQELGMVDLKDYCTFSYTCYLAGSLYQLNPCRWHFFSCLHLNVFVTNTKENKE